MTEMKKKYFYQKKFFVVQSWVIVLDFFKEISIDIGMLSVWSGTC